MRDCLMDVHWAVFLLCFGKKKGAISEAYAQISVDRQSIPMTKV